MLFPKGTKNRGFNDFDPDSMPKDLKRIDFMKREKNENKCKHNWRFLERWIGENVWRLLHN